MLKSKIIFASVFTSLALLITPAIALAHVAVQPSEVGVGKTQLFSISVPTEKEVSTVGVRVVLPTGLQEVLPTVKAGWKIETKKSSEGDQSEVTEISWTGGTIPTDQRDDFSFSAQVPAKATTLQWKAYQTYQDGSVVSWDQTPTGSDDATGDKGPYSTTEVVNDLTATTSTSTTKDKLIGPYVVAGLALLVAVGSILMKRI